MQGERLSKLHRDQQRIGHSMVTMEQEHSKVALCNEGKQTSKQAFFGLSGHGFCCGRRLIKCGRVTRQEARQEGNSHLEEADYLHRMLHTA